MIRLRRFGLLMCLLAPLGVIAEVFSARMTHVADGDTLWVMPQGSRVARKLRLQGLDAPEICQTGGLAARDALHGLLAHQPLRVTVNQQDNFGRGLALVHLEKQDVGALMVASGHAWSSRWQHDRGPYVAQENAARSARLGLFAHARPELPRDFRKRIGSCYPPLP